MIDQSINQSITESILIFSWYQSQLHTFQYSRQLVHFIFKQLIINDSSILDSGLLTGLWILRDYLLRLILSFTKLIQHCNLILFKRVVDSLSYCSIATDQLLHHLSVIFSLLTITLEVFSHRPQKFILFLLQQSFKTWKLTLYHLVVPFVCLC